MYPDLFFSRVLKINYFIPVPFQKCDRIFQQQFFHMEKKDASEINYAKYVAMYKNKIEKGRPLKAICDCELITFSPLSLGR